MLVRPILHLFDLQVVGQDHRGHGTVALCDSPGAVDQVRHLRGHGCGLDKGARHVLQKRLKINVLLVMRPHRGPRLLADQRDHRHVVAPGVVKTVEQVDRAGPRGRHAQPDLARELGMGRGAKPRHLLVPDLHEVDAGRVRVIPRFLLHPVQRADQAADSVARIAVDAARAPMMKPFPDEIRDRVRHAGFPPLAALCGGSTRPRPRGSPPERLRHGNRNGCHGSHLPSRFRQFTQSKGSFACLAEKWLASRPLR